MSLIPYGKSECEGEGWCVIITGSCEHQTKSWAVLHGEQALPNN